MRDSHKEWLKDRIRERCREENDGYCECDYPYHPNHTRGADECPEIIRHGRHFRPKYGIHPKRPCTLDNTMVVCRKCARQIDASLGRLR
jgi:hypothetical protein